MSYLPLEHKVLHFIRQHRLIKEGEKVLVALSGGIDSMVLLQLLYRLHFRVNVAHCNFKLRGKESDADEFLCEEVCKQLQIPFHQIHFDTLAYAGEKKISVQMAARELRYAWFRKLSYAHGYPVTATAHHLDDQAETVLLNLLTGKSVESMQGIPVRNNNIVRPLLNCTKEELHRYAVEKSLHWREDQSNEQNSYQRNYIRNEIMPMLQVMNPAVSGQLHTMAERMNEWNLLAEEGVHHLLSGCTEEKDGYTLFHLQPILDHPARKMLLWKLLSPYGFEGAIIQEIAHPDLQAGKKFHASPYTLRIDRNTAFLEKDGTETIENTYVIPEKTDLLVMEKGNLKIELVPSSQIAQIPPDSNQAFIDASKLRFPLEVRGWNQGDFFYPLGMDRPKKLSDFFIDKKIPVYEKHQKHLVLSDGNIIWIIGERIDHRYRMTENTEHVLHITYETHAG